MPYSFLAASRIASGTLKHLLDGQNTDSQHIPHLQHPLLIQIFLLWVAHHQHLTWMPCDENGVFLPPGTPPPPTVNRSDDDWMPFQNRTEFETAEFLFKDDQMSASKIDHLLNLWAATLAKHNDCPPFADHRDLYSTIDSSPLGDVKWDCFQVQYSGEKPDIDVPSWMSNSYDVWFRDPQEVIRNMLANPMFADEMDYRQYREFSSSNDECQWKDFMSGDWAWDQADDISKDPGTIGSTFIPVILGSNKTMVGMTKPEVAHFGDGHFRRVIYGLGPYIADYEEQVLLACIVRGWCPRCLAPRNNLDNDALDRFEEGTLGELWDDYGIVGNLIPFTNNFPRADINQLIAPDILHQLIKGAFKDHLIAWVEDYLEVTYGKPSFSGLQRFPEGRGFKQWTGDDSKALMKVYLPAIEGHVPSGIVQAFRALLEFCYYVRHNIISETSLMKIQDALARFHQHREAFQDAGVVSSFSLPRQHSLLHYPLKEPWRRSSRFNALGQMLRTNQWLDKLAAMRTDFTIPALTIELEMPQLSALLHQFLFEQLHPDDPRDLSNIPEFQFPSYDGRISIFNSASSRFYAPNDISGIGGMRTEYIRACPLWWNEAPRYDCIFVNTNPELEGMQGLDVVHVLCFFSFTVRGTTFPCAVIRWFDTVGDSADEDTGLWVVRPGFAPNHSPNISIIHGDTIYHAAHLIPVYGTHFISHDLKFHHSYDSFRFYYVNKYADHHAFEIAF
ncbi:hypothetical protein EDB19DRAFT_2003517 [Suillus lakei]|nr:hypothetical protein EDB19DRAFT_2003517 [Suillus lakei]